MDREDAKKQVGRMACLAYFPTSREGKKELVDTVVAACGSSNHAKKTVDSILETWTECPRPAEIWRIANEKKPPTLSRGCERCRRALAEGRGAIGWILERRGGYDWMRPCECNPVKVPTTEVTNA